MSSSERPQPSRTPLAGIHHLPPTARILQMAGTATDLIVQEIAFSLCFDYDPGGGGNIHFAKGPERSRLVNGAVCCNEGDWRCPSALRSY